MPRTTRNNPPPPSRFSRREALKAGLGLGALAATTAACGPMSNRCAGGPQEPADGAAQRGAARDRHDRPADAGEPVVRQLPGRAELDPSYRRAGVIDGLRGNEQLLDGDGAPVSLMRMVGNGAVDPKHDWVSSRTAFNGGRNDGFLHPNAGRPPERGA